MIVYIHWLRTVIRYTVRSLSEFCPHGYPATNH
jgi:hypothetical protein